jgi:hypothetical protein
MHRQSPPSRVSKVRQTRHIQIYAFAMKWDPLSLEQLALSSALGQ